jgi:predicted amidophosphoribosyltransferase
LGIEVDDFAFRLFATGPKLPENKRWLHNIGNCQAAAPGPIVRAMFAEAPRAAARLATRLCTEALDLFFPPCCLGCRKAVAGHGGLCAACWNGMSFIERPYCERLGAPFAQEFGGAGMISPQAAANPPVFARARAVAPYESEIARALVNRLKHYDRLELAWPMGRWMARAGAELLRDADFIVPTPLHRLRLAARRFNQSAALGKAISRESGVPMDTLALERVKPTAPQVGLTRAQRAANLAGAFSVDKTQAARFLDANIVLVDDVLTTARPPTPRRALC